MVACTAIDFYPGNISMTWFRNDRIVQGPEWPPTLPSTGQLFRAESLLKLTPEFSDANVNFSCHINHQALKGPEVLKFQLHLQGEYNLWLRKQGIQAVFLQLSSHSLFKMFLEIWAERQELAAQNASPCLFKPLFFKKVLIDSIYVTQTLILQTSCGLVIVTS